MSTDYVVIPIDDFQVRMYYDANKWHMRLILQDRKTWSVLRSHSFVEPDKEFRRRMYLDIIKDYGECENCQEKNTLNENTVKNPLNQEKK